LKLLVEVLLALTLGSAAAGACANETGGTSVDPLRPLLACSWGGQLAVQGVTRRAAGQNARAVSGPDGEQSVSVADGYRLMLAFPGSAPFVNLKLERSMPGRLAQDRAIIRTQMEAMGREGVLEVSQRGDVEILALDNSSLDGFSVISMVTLIAEQKNVIATAYVLNAKPDQRKFGNYQEYMVLRNAFVDALARCLAAP
jgi:hypothetical protein